MHGIRFGALHSVGAPGFRRHPLLVRPPRRDGGERLVMSSSDDRPPIGPLQAAISNGVVQTISEYTGRGPTKARTTITHDWVFVTLEDTLTKGERKLAESGRPESVLKTRHDFQSAMESDLRELVEKMMGRQVLAFMSANHIDPDVAIEVFALAPTASS